MISVVIPIFNSQEYIQECIRSITSQSYRDIEIICVDDGSTDDTPRILKKLQEEDSRIKVVTQKNKGRSGARNLGIQSAKGEFLTFVDSDDVLLPSALEKLSSNIGNADLVVSSIKMKYLIHSDKETQDNVYYTITREGVFNNNAKLLESFHCSVCACLFRTKDILQSKILFPEGLNYEDAFFHWVYFATTKKIAFVREPTYEYVRRPNSIMSQTFEKNIKALDHLLIIEKIIQYYKKYNFFPNDEWILADLLEKYFWLAFTYVPSSYRPRVLSECLRIIQTYNIKTEGFEDLEKIITGKVEFFFYAPNDEDFRLSIKLLSFLKLFFPNGSVRRKILFKLGRVAYKIIPR